MNNPNTAERSSWIAGNVMQLEEDMANTCKALDELNKDLEETISSMEMKTAIGATCFVELGKLQDLYKRLDELKKEYDEQHIKKTILTTAYYVTMGMEEASGK